MDNFIAALDQKFLKKINLAVTGLLLEIKVSIIHNFILITISNYIK